MKPLSLLLPLFLLALASCSAPPPPAEVADNRPSTLIIVHGLYANANSVSQLTEALRSQGFTCHAPNLQPNDGSVTIEALAQQLDSYIEQTVAPDTPLQLIGHSMGGLVALQYLQEPAHARRCRGLSTIASPHHGTFLASFHGGAGARQMTTNSAYLQQLNSQTPSFPVTTYRSTRDIVILPNTSSELPYATNKVITSNGHIEILQSPELHRDLAQSIRNREPLAAL